MKGYKLTIKFKFLMIVAMITDGLLHAGMVSRRIAPLSRISSTTTKAAQSLFTVPTITPVLINKKSSFNTATSKSFESSGGVQQTKKYWGRKVIPLLAVAGFYKIGDILMNKSQNKKDLDGLKKIVFDHSDDLAVVDPEMYDVCLQIMKDYGIREHVNFRVKHSNVNIQFEQDDSDENKLRDVVNTANNLIEVDTIIFSPFYKIYSKPHLIKIIAHELEHTRQFHRYSGSYHGDFNNRDDARKLEQAADGAALDYQYCPECILSQTLPYGPILSAKPYEPEETEHGYFTSKLGYWAIPDYELYANRDDCKIGDARCLAHKYSQYAHIRQDIPLKKYLPVMKPSLPSVKK